MSNLTPQRVEVANGRTIAYSETGVMIAKWDRELAPAEVAAYLDFPGQIFQPQPRQYPAYGRTQPPRLVIHADGAPYIHLGTAHGAGKSRGAPAIEVYRSVDDGRLWFRDPADFAERMK